MPGGITFNHFDLTEETIQPPLTLRRTLPGGPGQGALSPALRVSRHLLPSELNRGGRGVSPAGTRGGGALRPALSSPPPGGAEASPGSPRVSPAPGSRSARLSPRLPANSPFASGIAQAQWAGARRAESGSLWCVYKPVSGPLFAGVRMAEWSKAPDSSFASRARGFWSPHGGVGSNPTSDTLPF